MLKQQLNFKLSQKLSPQQIQLMKLIQLPTLEFEQRISQEMEENPALEGGKEERDNEDSYEEENYDDYDDGNEIIETDINVDDYLSDDEIPNYKLSANNYSTDDEEESSQDSPHTGAADQIKRKLAQLEKEKQRLTTRKSPRLHDKNQQELSSDDEDEAPNKTAKRKLPMNKGGKGGKPPRPTKRATTAKKKTTRVKKEAPVPKTAAPRYTTIEDVCLARAWIGASEDEVVGANRTGTVYWKAVKKRFDVLYEESEAEVKQEYDWKSLNNRWNRHINLHNQLFLKYWKAAVAKSPSGTNEALWLEAAKEQYLQEEGRQFKYEECFQFLKDAPKFNGVNEIQQTEQAAANKDNRNNTAPAMAGGTPRPVGQKQAKAARRGSIGSSVDTSSSKAIEKLADTQAKLNAVLSLRDQRKTWTSLAQMCLQMGDHEGAKQYMDLLSASTAPALAPGPPSIINTSTQSPAAAAATAAVDNNDDDDDDELLSPIGGGKTTGLEEV